MRRSVALAEGDHAAVKRTSAAPHARAPAPAFQTVVVASSIGAAAETRGGQPEPSGEEEAERETPKEGEEGEEEPVLAAGSHWRPESRERESSKPN